MSENVSLLFTFVCAGVGCGLMTVIPALIIKGMLKEILQAIKEHPKVRAVQEASDKAESELTPEELTKFLSKYKLTKQKIQTVLIDLFMN